MQIPVFKDEALPALSRLEPEQTAGRLGSTLEGLSLTEAQERLKTFGSNLLNQENQTTIAGEFWGRLYNPLNALLLTMTATSYFLGDLRAAIVILAMVVLAVVTAFIQEHRSNQPVVQVRAAWCDRCIATGLPERGRQQHLVGEKQT